ncbi:Inversin [Tolypocladium paradoxum]|uniref:Inversin n=1 Tax=Tolypocladium paradoxum TaxID=94208 RepID=A0A2S4KYL3_9HYPO|nr:Inversin [Tolypocladium paradoxum]
MFELLKAPRELIRAIGECLGSEADINSLVQASTTKHSLLNDHLYRHNAQRSAGCALRWAARAGIKSTAQIALRNGPNVNAVGKGITSTALVLAAAEGHADIVKLLLCQQDVDVNARSCGGLTALHMAAWHGHPEVSTDFGIDINSRDLKFGGTALFWAAHEVNLDSVHLFLIREDVDVNVAIEDGWTPLITAARFGHAPVINLLLACNNVDPNWTSQGGTTALV